MAYYDIKEADLFDCEDDDDDEQKAAADKKAAQKAKDDAPRVHCSSSDSQRKVVALQKALDAKHQASIKKKAASK